MRRKGSAEMRTPCGESAAASKRISQTLRAWNGFSLILENSKGRRRRNQEGRRMGKKRCQEKGAPRVPETAPRQPQESPRQPQESPNRAQDSPKRAPRQPQGAPEVDQTIQKGVTGLFWSWIGLARAITRAPGTPKGPGRVPEGPRGEG